MPDLRSLPRTPIRGHPGVVPTKDGNHLKEWVLVFTGDRGFRLEFIPMEIGAGMTPFMKTVVYGETPNSSCGLTMNVIIIFKSLVVSRRR
jgi:hypothetical protein